MNIAEAIIVQGGVETDAEVLNDTVHSLQCPNGHAIRVASGIVLGDRLSVMASDAKEMICPQCGSTVNLN